MIGDIKDKELSSYQPSPEIMELTMNVQRDAITGNEIINRPWEELNNYSVIDDTNRGKRMFNAFVDESSEDPTEAWKWRGTRSMARNKGIAMHAQLTSAYLLPMFDAQNPNDETDRDFSEVMRDVVEWMALPTNSDYQASFLQVTFGMMENPVTYMGAEFFEVYQTIREKTDQGYEKKEILDEVLSGFRAPVYGPTEILITNAYERNIQKQRAICKKRWIDIDEAEAVYGDHENFDDIRAGRTSVFNQDDHLFYDIYDEDRKYMVEEFVWLNRREDAEIPFLGGVYMGNGDVHNNPIRHRDNRGAPKYNVIPFGYMRIGEHFAYYKSMMNALSWDNDLYDAMSEVIMNNALLEQDPPSYVSGTDKVDQSLNFPGAMAAFDSNEVKVQPIFPPKNFVAGFQSLRETEDSINKGSVNETLSGQLPQASQKAFNVAQAQNNARKLISSVHKSLGESVAQFGDLMKDIAINKITVPEMSELVGGRMKLKYPSLFLRGPDAKNKKLIFSQELIGLELTDKDKRARNLELFSKSKGETIMMINPEMFAKFKYFARINVEEMTTKNQEYWQGLLSQLAAQLSQNPYINQEALTRKLMHSFFQSEAEELMQKNPQNQGVNTPPSPLGQGFEGKQVSTALQGAVL